LIDVLVRPGWLWALVGANAFLAAVRLAATVDAWGAGTPLRAASTRLWRAAAAALTLVMLLPHVVVHLYATDALHLLDEVFGDRAVAPLEQREAELLAEGFTEEDLGPTPSSSTPLPSSTSTPPPTTGTPSSSTSASTSTLPPTTTTTRPEPQEVLGERVTVLLAGGDFGPGRYDLRTDVMILASLDLAASKASLISISRDLVQAPLPAAWAQSNTMLQTQRWHEDRAYAEIVAEAASAGREPPPQAPFVPCNCFADRINYLHVLTSTWVRTFPDAPDPGMEALRQTLEVTLGIAIDDYVLVDFAGFVDLVDALGGVTITVTESMNVAFSEAREGEDPVAIDVEPGVHHLDGHQALAYVRNRTGSSDQERMRRQRCMIRELAAAADPMTLLRGFPAIARAIRESTTTTLDLEELPAIIDAVTSLNAEDIATLAISAPWFSRGSNYMELPIIDAGRARAAVADLLAGVAAGTTLGNAADECP